MMLEGMRHAADAEREECAKACERMAELFKRNDDTVGWAQAARLCAKQIRARGAQTIQPVPCAHDTDPPLYDDEEEK